jgi:hypothetical protein
MKRFFISYAVVFGGATAVVLFGYIVGSNFLFSPHGGLGWLFVLFMLLGGIVAGGIYAGTQPSGQKLSVILQMVLGLPVFCGLAFVLITLMPDAWNDWIFPISIERH